ncbi:hypothetical protein [Hydrogenophaga sp. NFH-34]|uniref:hypothetical protein n=1 Tax=Hydrogenophaga sp. NFH-34 TaxID=2744446 RepID=UPI001F2BF7E6|nr:hypothetical protein [Hydrogenophaga sp. NFH-34]
MRFIMHPSQHELIEVNERLNALANESQASRALSALVQFASEAGTLPRWFLAMERKEFSTSRAKAIRFTIAEANPALKELIAELLPMSQVKRDLHITQLIGKACEKHRLGGGAGSTESSKPSLVLPSTPLPGLAPLKPLEVDQEDQPIDQATLKRRFKNNLDAFL